MIKFSSLRIATNYANRAFYPKIIILGDDNKYWVVDLKDGEKLINQGYEYEAL